MCLPTTRDHALQLAWVCSRVLETRVRLLVEPQIQEEKSGFPPGHGSLDSFLPSRVYWRGRESLPNQSTCVLWIWRKLLTMSLKEYWVDGLLTPLWVGGESPSQVEDFEYLRVLFKTEGKMEWKTDGWIEATSAVMQMLKRSVVVERADPVGKAFHLQVNLCPNSHQCP